MISRNSAALLEPVPGGVAHEEQSTPVTLEAPSFKAVYAKYFDFVWAAAGRLGVKPWAMDDVVQEIFMVVHSRLHTLQRPEALRSWLYGVVRRTVATHRRSRRTRDVSDAAFASHARALEQLPPTPLDLTEHHEEAKLLWELLAELDSRKREVLVLVEVEGMSVPEVSDILKIPLNTAYSRLRRARVEFEQALGRRAAQLHARAR